MKKLSLILVACLGLVGCADEYYATPSYPLSAGNQTQYGCVIVSDEYGEREVCNTHYYYSDGGVVYWDAHFGIWVYPNGYWYGGRFWPGVYPGFHAYYHTGFYHPRGFYRGRPADLGWHGGGRPPPGGFRGPHGGHR